MQATAKMAMGGGFRRNSDSELKLKNRCTGSTSIIEQDWSTTSGTHSDRKTEGLDSRQ